MIYKLPQQVVKTRYVASFLLLIIITGITGCNQKDSPTLTPTRFIETTTITLTPTNTNTPTPSPTFTPFPTSTLIPTDTPTPTEIPLLNQSPEQLEQSDLAELAKRLGYDNVKNLEVRRGGFLYGDNGKGPEVLGYWDYNGNWNSTNQWLDMVCLSKSK